MDSSSEHPDDLFTTHHAARRLGVSPATVKGWFRRGHVKPAYEHPHRGRLFRLADLQAAELAARLNSRRSHRKPVTVSVEA